MEISLGHHPPPPLQLTSQIWLDAQLLMRHRIFSRCIVLHVNVFQFHKTNENIKGNWSTWLTTQCAVCTPWCTLSCCGCAARGRKSEQWRKAPNRSLPFAYEFQCELCRVWCCGAMALRIRISHSHSIHFFNSIALLNVDCEWVRAPSPRQIIGNVAHTAFPIRQIAPVGCHRRHAGILQFAIINWLNVMNGKL